MDTLDELAALQVATRSAIDLESVGVLGAGSDASAGSNGCSILATVLVTVPAGICAISSAIVASPAGCPGFCEVPSSSNEASISPCDPGLYKVFGINNCVG